MKRILTIAIPILSVAFLVTGCYYDSEEELYGATTCDTSNVTYAGTVNTILISNSCYSCHGTPATNGAPFSLEGYSNLNAHKDRLLGAINHSSSYAAMPMGLPKMNQCDINKIAVWMQAGAPNN
jgi:hypothetical protein